MTWARDHEIARLEKPHALLDPAVRLLSSSKLGDVLMLGGLAAFLYGLTRRDREQDQAMMLGLALVAGGALCSGLVTLPASGLCTSGVGSLPRYSRSCSRRVREVDGNVIHVDFGGRTSGGGS